jgi:predicted dehydrogenase
MGGVRRPDLNGTFDVEDLGCGLIRFDNDATLFVEASWASHVGQSGANVHLFGSNGGASLDPCVIYTDLYGDVTVDIRPEVPQLYGHEGEIQHFIDCVLDSGEPMVPLEHGIMVQRMIDGIYASARSGAEHVFGA